MICWHWPRPLFTFNSMESGSGVNVKMWDGLGAKASIWRPEFFPWGWPNVLLMLSVNVSITPVLLSLAAKLEVDLNNLPAQIAWLQQPWLQRLSRALPREENIQPHRKQRWGCWMPGSAFMDVESISIQTVLFYLNLCLCNGSDP